jgi:hypothetical protein
MLKWLRPRLINVCFGVQSVKSNEKTTQIVFEYRIVCSLRLGASLQSFMNVLQGSEEHQLNKILKQTRIWLYLQHALINPRHYALW